MSLYLKHRPTTLDDIQGNAGVIDSLKSIFSKPREEIPHVFLFKGIYGGGKTTLARIIADMLGCKGRDLLEINAADNNGVDDMRDLDKRMQRMPQEGPCRVVIIDEAHKITKAAQNMLLKPLEDTSSKSYFILVTSEHIDLLPTVLSRCLTYEVSPLNIRAMTFLLRKVCKKEGKEVPESILVKIAEKAEGSSRCALVMLDKVIDMPPDRMEQAIAKDGNSDMNPNTLELCRALASNGDWTEIANILTLIRNTESDMDGVRKKILGYFAAILLKNPSVSKFNIGSCFTRSLNEIGHSGLVLQCYEAYNSR